MCVSCRLSAVVGDMLAVPYTSDNPRDIKLLSGGLANICGL